MSGHVLPNQPANYIFLAVCHFENGCERDKIRLRDHNWLDRILFALYSNIIDANQQNVTIFSRMLWIIRSRDVLALIHFLFSFPFRCISAIWTSSHSASKETYAKTMRFMIETAIKQKKKATTLQQYGYMLKRTYGESDSQQTCRNILSSIFDLLHFIWAKINAANQ